MQKNELPGVEETTMTALARNTRNIVQEVWKEGKVLIVESYGKPQAMLISNDYADEVIGLLKEKGYITA